MRAVLVGCLFLTLSSACIERSKRVGIYCDKQEDCTDPAQPLCDTEFHTCYGPDAGVALIPCTPNTQCPARVPVCNMGFCTGCTSNEQCMPNVCQANGSCAPLGDTLYVDSKNGTCTGVHAGTKDDPYCQVTMAIGVALAAQKPIIRVAGISTGGYDAIDFKPTAPFNLTILGPDAPTPQSSVVFYKTGSASLNVDTAATGTLTFERVSFYGDTLSNAAAIACVGNNVTLNVSEGDVSGAGFTGVQVAGCKVTIAKSRIYSNKVNGIGVTSGSLTFTDGQVHDNGSSGFFLGSDTTVRGATVFNNGNTGASILGNNTLKVSIEQSAFYHNQGGAITVSGEPKYSIVNNVIWSNPYGVHLEGTNGTFMFNTVANNNPSGGSAIECRDPLAVRYSIVVGNGKNSKGSQIESNCALTSVITGSGDMLGIAKSVEFDGSQDVPFRLKTNSTLNRDCCVDKVDGQTGFPNLDYLGVTRPKGAKFDIGAYEIE